jgi:hypothetical protein
MSLSEGRFQILVLVKCKPPPPYSRVKCDEEDGTLGLNASNGLWFKLIVSI